jgi:acyl-CoA synthetase (AMP-forming)/AMP-acid ligase II
VKTLADLIDRNARLHADRVAVIDGEVIVTHRELADLARGLAAGLRDHFGMVPQDRFLILSQNRLEVIVALAASAVGGFILVPLNWRLAAAELSEIVSDAEPKIVLVEAGLKTLWDQVIARSASILPFVLIGGISDDGLSFDNLVAAGAPSTVEAVDPEAVAHVIYTSGTTGRPKGAMLTQTGMLAGAEQMSAYAGHRPTDRIVVVMPLFHVGGIIEWYAVQYLGGACVVLPRFEPRDFFIAVERHQATVAHLAPVMVKRLAEAPERSDYDLSSLVRIHYGSAPVPPEHLRRAHAAFGPILNQLYGMTESPAVSMLLAYQQEPGGAATAQRRLASAGHVYPNADVWIERPDGKTCGANEIGELIVRSAAQFIGYWRNPAATAETLIDGAVRTGDLGMFDADGYLYIVDRAKDVIVSGGENIYSREVEDALMAHVAVAEAAVVGAPDERWGEAVVAHIVLKPGAQVDPDALIAHCRTLIAGYKRPRRIEIDGALPRLPHGKIDKKALRARYWQGRERMVS